MKAGHALISCALWPILLLLGCSVANNNLSGTSIMLPCCPGPDFTEENIAFAEKNLNFFSLNVTASSRSLVSLGCVINNGLGICNHRPLFQEIALTLNYDTHRNCNHGLLFQGNKRITPSYTYRRRKRWTASKRIIYYNNSTATFRLLLIGDLVFKLNPGPLGERIEALYRPVKLALIVR